MNKHRRTPGTISSQTFLLAICRIQRQMENVKLSYSFSCCHSIVYVPVTFFPVHFQLKANLIIIFFYFIIVLKLTTFWFRSHVTRRNSFVHDSPKRRQKQPKQTPTPRPPSFCLSCYLYFLRSARLLFLHSSKYIQYGQINFWRLRAHGHLFFIPSSLASQMFMLYSIVPRRAS